MRIDDMTRTGLSPEGFDIVAAVEVLEHVEQDDDFVSNVRKVLQPGGVFILTTPNGDTKPDPTGDHKRHYRGAQLEALLSRYFERVQVSGCIIGGRTRRWGLKPWSLRRPFRTLRGMVGNLINRVLSATRRSGGTCHLIAECSRPLRSA